MKIANRIIENLNEKANDVGLFSATIKKIGKVPYGEVDTGVDLLVDVDGKKVSMQALLSKKKGISGDIKVGDQVKVNVAKNAYRVYVDSIVTL